MQEIVFCQLRVTNPGQLALRIKILQTNPNFNKPRLRTRNISFEDNFKLEPKSYKFGLGRQF
uniref:Uncharacterized protein n=1 Tax=Romanomermis culicivorax TaxID=13658 RepID=A0A915I2Q1_ROMCU